MPQTEHGKVLIRKAKRQAEKKRKVDELSSLLHSYTSMHDVKSLQHLQRLFVDAANQLCDNPNSKIVKKVKKSSNSDIMCYSTVGQHVWDTLHSRIPPRSIFGRSNCSCVSQASKRPLLSIKEGSKTAQDWIEGGGDERTTILCSHIALCHAGKFPENKKDEASHLCHNPRCILLSHLNWEPKSVNAAREKCRQDGKCCQHEGFPNCLL